MEFLLLLVVIGVVAYLMIPRGKKQPSPQPIITTSTTGEGSNEDAMRFEREKIRAEIKEAIAPHKESSNILWMLARIDGSSSDPERRIIFNFLQEEGAEIREERHFTHFNGTHAGEWQRAATMEEFAKACEPLSALPSAHKLNLLASAMAIVASGGAAKKTEKLALNYLKKITLESIS